MGSGISTAKKTSAKTHANRPNEAQQESPNTPQQEIDQSPYLESMIPDSEETDDHIRFETSRQEQHGQMDHTVQLADEVGLAIAFTPRENEKSASASSSFSGVPYTPHGEEATIFKYYCPLCMLYFKGIMKMKCCSNYLCVQCCTDYVATKGFDLGANPNVTHIEDKFMSSNSVYCPHCQVSGFHPLGVSFEEIVRDYTNRLVPRDQNSLACYSPLRVGESFEDLKRKMIPYKNTTSTFSIVSENNQDVDVEEQVHPFEPSGAGEGSSRRRQQPAVAGIAMLSSGEETPVLRSPRLRLEPDTPDHLPFSLYLPDHSGRVNFDSSDRLHTNIITSARLERNDAEETNSLELHVSALFDLRSGGDSPRTHSGRVIDPAHLTAEVSRSVQLPDRPPLSRSNSTSRAADDSSLVLSARRSEKTQLQGHCSFIAADMVDRMVSTALAQYPRAEFPVSSQ